MPDAPTLNLEEHLPRFGLASFRPGQRDVISAVLADEDCLCVMPTGGGKSLCYQLPAVARPGLALVVSPLIALMQDQVTALQALGLSATFINSTLDPSEQQARLDELAAGAYDLVYVAAERFRSSRFLEAVRATRLQLLAIDEAHCISEWGHDFRPDYARLGRYRERLGNPPTIALTATATDAVRRDIVAQLGLRDPRVFITGFARPNLHYEVLTPQGQKQKDEALLRFLDEAGRPGIIYASTRKRCEEVAETIRDQRRLRVGVYHAGLEHDDRRRAQEQFMRGGLDVVVATNAFGMGIDKADVRFVLHYNLPGTLEAYYQEAGRAGRDGRPSQCLLLYSQGDRFLQEFFIDSAYPPRQTVRQICEFLRSFAEDPIELTQQEIKETLGLNISAEGVGACEQLLEKAGALERLEPRQNMAIVRIDSDLPTLVDLLPRQAAVRRKVLQTVEQFIGGRRGELVYFRPPDMAERAGIDPTALARALRELKSLKAFDYVPPFRGRAIHVVDRETPFDELDIDFETLEKRKAAEYEKLERVISFARGNSCRQLDILRYFGQEDGAPCGLCDNCRSGPKRDTGHGARVSDDDTAVVEAVRKALSGVARTHSRFGKHLVAQMLCGSKAAKITRNKLDRLSTYGILGHLRQEEVVAMLDALLAAGWIEQSEVDHQRPTVQLTDAGALVMRGQAGLEGLLLPEGVAQRLRDGSSTPRSSLGDPAITRPSAGASEAGGREPASRPAARPPAGPTFGDSATGSAPAVVAESQDDPAPVAAEPPRSEADSGHAGSAPSVPSGGRSTHYWTWRLLVAGFTPDECATIRGIDGDVVLDHALRAAEEGRAIEMGWFLSPPLAATMEQVIGPAEPARIRPLLPQLPRGTRYEQVQWFLKCRRPGPPEVPLAEAAPSAIPSSLPAGGRN